MIKFSEISTDAIRYWELRRILFNLLLVVVFLVAMILSPRNYEVSLQLFWASAVGLSVLAVLANLCYCIVYPIDLFIQCSDFRERWRRWRFILFIFGTLFACSLAGFMGNICTMAGFAG
jgi:hypothetical protein